MTLYIVTSEKKKKVIASKSYTEIADFIKTNQDARVRTIDWTSKTKILHKKVFLTNFLKATENKEEFFALTEIMIPLYKNYRYFLAISGLLEEYKEYKANL